MIKNLEIALKYAGSDELEGLGFPKDRYGLALNQTIFEGMIASLAFLHDEFDENDKDGRDDRRKKPRLSSTLPLNRPFSAAKLKV